MVAIFHGVSVIISLTILSTHLLWCLCRNERIITHDTFQDTIPTIVLESGTHVQREVSHLFFRYTQWWMDILITKDGFWTLMDVIIANSIRTNMLQWTLMMITYVAMMAIQEKTWSYTKWAPCDDFIPLAIETYGCLHSCFDLFLIACA